MGSHVFTKLSVEELKSIDAAIISARQWSVIAAKDFAVIMTPETLAKISPEKTVLFTDAQLDSLDEKTIMSFSVDQIKQVGTESGASLSAFKMMIEKLENNKADALKDRISNQHGYEKILHWQLIRSLIIGVIAIIVFAGALIFIVRKNKKGMLGA